MVRLIVEFILTIIVQLVTIFGLLLRWLPSLLSMLCRLLRVILVISRVTYGGILGQLRPLGMRRRIDLLRNPWRSIATTLMSPTLGVLVMAVAGWDITLPAVVVCAIHGLVVGVVWNQLAPPIGISLGA